MTGETFTAEQLVDAANIILDRIAPACDCFPCAQERSWADMLTYAAGLRVERDALIASVEMLCGEIDRVKEPRPHFHNEAFRPLPVDDENTDR